MEHLHNGHFVCYVMFPMSKNVFWNLTDIQAEHSYSLSEDSAPQSPALSIKMDQESGRSSYSFKGFIKLYIVYILYYLTVYLAKNVTLIYLNGSSYLQIWMHCTFFSFHCLKMQVYAMSIAASKIYVEL